ncbi:transcriptional regulator [Rhizobium chutanense]|uniref:Transcriptional regulator n=1 Tax=Rhizobium chutanense TaxID=2035448 RepID=A0A2A6JIH7_9HYPH|nr:S24 family peptidase [Rhizobium chutanense]PDT05738.1 transcriptional regulator [Rhizobium chutanense]
MTFSDRLKELQGTLRDSDFSRKTGVSVQTLKRYEDGSSPSIDIARKIADACNVSLDWLADRSELRNSSVSLQAKAEGDFVNLPRFDARASAGQGLVAINQMPVGEVAFARDFLRNLGANPDYCYILEARGDSMWPTIPDGALLIADASKTDVDDGRIYHFNVMDRVLVKRARWSMDGKLHLTSDNMAAGFPPEIITADRIDELKVGGRIMFTGHAPMPVR